MRVASCHGVRSGFNTPTATAYRRWLRCIYVYIHTEHTPLHVNLLYLRVILVPARLTNYQSTYPATLCEHERPALSVYSLQPLKMFVPPSRKSLRQARKLRTPLRASRGKVRGSGLWGSVLTGSHSAPFRNSHSSEKQIGSWKILPALGSELA